MRLRLGQCWMTCLICVGCHSLADVELRSEPQPNERAQQLWEQGQAAMKAGQPDQAIDLYQKSLDEDRERGKNHLSLAAAYLEKGDDRAACAHLGLFLQSHPEHRNARFYHGELLLKLGRHRVARLEFEQAIRHEQGEREPDLQHLVHCHTRLVEIGEALDADYLVHLHRGIGMLLLAMQRATLTDPEGELPTEALLCKAAAELSRARALRPSEARACWYLHLAWRQLAQHAPARHWLAEARRLAPVSDLNPTEQRDLSLACRARLEPSLR
jgi:tetratricopeptide (TPR) repeat protein